MVIRSQRKQGELDEGSQNGRKAMTNLDSVLKRHRFADKGPYGQSSVFFSGHVQIRELDHQEG